MNRRTRRLMEREYNKNKNKLLKRLTDLQIPTEKDIEEYIMEKTNSKIVEPIKVTQQMSDELKEYYNTK